MDNQDKDSDFESQDDILGDDFSEEGFDDFDDLDDLDLPEEDSFDDGFGDEFGDEFSDQIEDDETFGDDPYGEGEWGDDDDAGQDGGLAAGAGLRKERKFDINLSFNAMAIIGALIVGSGVLGYQLMTNKPAETVERFISAIGMSGLTDGPIFGGGGEEKTADAGLTMDQVSGADNKNSGDKNNEGFLYNPDILQDMEMAPRIDDAPPMPTPITAEEEAGDDTAMAGSVPRSPPDYGAMFDGRNKPQDDTQERAPIEKPVQRDEDPIVDLSTKAVPDKVEKTPALDQAMKQEPRPQATTSPLEDTAQGDDPFGDALSQMDRRMDLFGQSEEPDQVKTEKTTDQKTVVTDKPAPTKKVETKQAKVEKVVPEPEKAVAKQPAKKIADNMVPAAEVEKVTEELQAAQQELQTLKAAQAKRTQEIDALKQQVEELSTAQKQSAQELAKRAAVPVKAQEPVAAKTAPVPAPVAKQPAPKTRASASTKNAAATQPKWELRAAMPDKAWIARSGLQTLTPVVVGDMIDGMGRVRSIRMVSGRWVIDTTKGQIRQ